MAEEKTIPFLSEHERSLDNASKPSEYNPSTEEKKTMKMAQKLFDKAKKARMQFDEHWLEDYKFFRGKQWIEQRPTYRHSEVINFVFSTIQAVVPIMTDSKPKFDFLPQEPNDLEAAKIFSDVAQADWEKNNWQYTLTEILYDSHIYGTGFAECSYDPEGNDGIGEITIEREDPFYIFPDPEGKDVNKKMTYFCVAKPVDTETLKNRYPQHKEFIKADLEDFIQGDKRDLNKVKFKSPVDNNTILDGRSANSIESKDKALELTVYVYDKDYDEEEVAKTSDDGEPMLNPETGNPEMEFIQRLKYPRGRKIVIAGGVLVVDDHIPFDDGKIPFARMINYADPGCFWGISEIEQIKGPQKIFNKLVSFSLDVLTLMGNPIWVVDTAADIDTDQLFNRPGLVIEKSPGSEVRREEGVQLQPYVLQLIDRMQSWFQEIHGARDVTQGARPEGVTAAAAISELQESALTRIRQKSRNMDCFLQDLGTLYLNRMIEFYDSPRVIRLTGDNNAQKYFRMRIDRDDNGNKAIVTRGLGATGEELQEKRLQLNSKFDVRVTTGSALPFAKAKKANLAFQLFDRGALDPESLLEAVDYPNKEKVLQRLEEQAAKAAEAQAMAEGGAPPQ